ncbi:hypothetical protein Tco_0341684 [Tanacetum coccineum]
MVADHRSTTAGPPLDHRRTTGQRWLTASQGGSIVGPGQVLGWIWPSIGLDRAKYWAGSSSGHGSETMTEELDEQQRQQVMLDAALVPINEQILKQYSFYNALIPIEDVLEIYKQEFWITPKDRDQPFTPLASEKEIIRFINELGCPNPIKIVSALRVNDLYQPWTSSASTVMRNGHGQFIKLIIKYVMSKNDKIPKRPLSFQHVIKLDTTLGNLKLANKGTIDPVFRMAILALMLNGKGLISKKGVEIDVEQLRIPKRRRSKIVTEEVYESEQMDDLGDFEETEEEEVVPLVRKRSIGVVIGEEAHQELEVEEERIDNSEKLKGLKTLSVAAQLNLDMKKALKASKDDFYIQKCSKGSGEGSNITPEVPDELVHKSLNEGAGVNLEVLDESDSSSSSSSSYSEVAVEDISSDEDEVTKKADNTKTADAEKDIKVQVADEQVAEKQADGEVLNTDQGGNKPASKVHPDAHTAAALLQKPEATLINLVEPEVQSMVDVPFKQATPAALRHPLIDTTMTIILDTTTNKDESIENGVYRLERQVNAMSKFSIQEVVDKSVEARLKQIDLSKDVYDFRKIKQEKAAKMMEKVKAFNRHPAYKSLFDTLAVSLSVDVDNMDMLPDQPIQKKRRRDDHDKDLD